jgi:hypothetical protein
MYNNEKLKIIYLKTFSRCIFKKFFLLYFKLKTYNKRFFIKHILLILQIITLKNSKSNSNTILKFQHIKIIDINI